MLDLATIHKVHFVGIGGIGMSALARIFLSQGKTVTGSDQEDSELIADLQKEGIKIEIGHKELNLGNSVELVVITEAISEDNVELKKAKILGLPILTYFQALGLLSRDYYCVAVCGAHGKTTSTAMAGLSLIKGGLDPTVVIGSKVKEFDGKNVRIGKSKYLVVEACEYRRSFLNLQPNLILITNIEADHLDYYKDGDDYRLAFEEFAGKLPKDGILVVNGDDEEIQKVLQKNFNARVKKFGWENTNDYWLEKREIQSMQGKSGELDLKVIGRYNLLNALGVFTMVKQLGVGDMSIIEALYEFKGTWRRFEFKGKRAGIELYDDYAHHPTEIKMTLKAAREKFGNKKICLIYQPHQYNRTKMLFNDFVKSFNDADLVIIPNIYKVRDKEEDIAEMSPEVLVEGIKKNNPNVLYGNGFENTVKILNKRLAEGDILMTMGAGDVFKIGEMWFKNNSIKRQNLKGKVESGRVVE